MERREFLRLALRAGLLTCVGCSREGGLLLPARESEPVNADGLRLLLRLAHISDTHLVDEESPARFAGGHMITDSAWRPFESYSTQLLDGIIRTVNRIHASGRTIDFLLHTGDACDNVEMVEYGWFLGLLDGGAISPLTGPDDRPPATRPPPELDPHAIYEARGLYRRGVHGELSSIPWYALLGNHDVYSIGVFPIFERESGHRVAPLPLEGRPGLVLPVVLDPVASQAYGRVTPAEPGPPCLFERPRYVEPNPARAFFDKGEYAQALFDTTSGPEGHGFAGAPEWGMWYSVNPVAGVRLIGLDTTDAVTKDAGGLYFDGAVSRVQLDYLRQELELARERDELVIVATHHPSGTLATLAGTQVLGDEFRRLLAEHPNVVLHLCGHRHRHRVMDHGSYLEIETCSTLDLPQEGRLIELWRDDRDGSVTIAYEVFSHLDDSLPPLGEDPLRALREEAYALAVVDKGATARQMRLDPSGAQPAGREHDRRGRVMIRR